jgi:DNA polymerase-3 subunit alpha
LSIDERLLNEISSQIIHSVDEKYGYKATALDTKAVLEELMKSVSGDAYKFMFIASRMEGLPRHTSTHAAGIIISSVDLDMFIPMQQGINGMKQSQLEAVDLESIGLLKMDFLGIRNLSIIDSLMQEVGGYNAINLYNKIPLDDKLTYKLLCDGETLGIFQLESEGITRTIMKLHPDKIEDIVAVLALYRPGPMENIDEFIARKHGKKFSYIHNDLKDILGETYGIIVYQEQIMLIAQRFAGYSLGEADVLRRAVSKKKEEVLISERDKFVKSSQAKGYSSDVANKIYDDIVKFANYGFNKSHSVAYALFSYVMAYFKANYPTIFVSKILNNVIGSVKSTTAYLAYAKKCGLKILPPSINYASYYYVVHDDKLFMPFNAIKGVGIQQTKDIIEERKNGVFTSFKEFKQRVKISESSLQALIYCGAFDEFNQTKKSMLDDVSGNSDVIDSFLEDRILSLDEIDDEILQQKEKELLGFNLVYNIYANIDSIIHNNKASYIKDLRPNIGYRVIGAFIDCKEILTKKNELMLVGSISDGSNEINVVIFPNDYIKIKPIIRLNKLYKIDGKTRFDNERQRLQLIINDVYKC